MKTPRERALAIVYELSGLQVSPKVFAVILEDSAELGGTLRKMLAAIEKGITTDRREVAAETAPS